MSYCRREGKDIIHFTTKNDHQKPSSVEISPSEPTPGLIMPDGSINWNCPCLGGMATGPCGMEFREAFTCFHYSTADPKGSNCYLVFADMQNCMSQYPKVYDKTNDEEEFSMIDNDQKVDKIAGDEKEFSMIDKDKKELKNIGRDSTKTVNVEDKRK